MKKIITAISFLFFIGYANAQTDPVIDTGRVKYDYYPDANVYYNNAEKKYWYYDSTGSMWQSNLQLPGNYSIDSTRKNTFYYEGGSVWKLNTTHMKKYGSKAKPPKKSS
ncbi:MAG: hypothetical protein ABIQ31_07695 [Ferruginibacter sp.]